MRISETDDLRLVDLVPSGGLTGEVTHGYDGICW